MHNISTYFLTSSSREINFSLKFCANKATLYATALTALIIYSPPSSKVFPPCRVKLKMDYQS